ncbi:MAG TPA: glycosyltransferase [Solirubrobacteraceae bacterium]|nr:glycosyltransferase [Solirubrobacteraceae bacterium]
MTSPAPPAVPLAASSSGACDVLLVSLASTPGLRHADAELLASLRRAGATAALASALPPSRTHPTFALTDLAWALAARRAAQRALAACAPRAILYSTTTAALLWPRPGAIRFDALAAANRPGRHGLWQRPLERRRLRQASLLLPWSERSPGESSGLAGGLGDGSLFGGPARARTRGGARARGLPLSFVLPVPVDPSAPPHSPPAVRDIPALTYAANPRKKGLDRVLSAWAAVRAPGELLYVAGTTPSELAAASIPIPSEARDGVRLTGILPPKEYRALLRRTRVFVTAPRREDYGLAQLEALADGCLLATTPAPGPYAALPILRSLDPRLVSEDLSAALRVALRESAPSATGTGPAKGGNAAEGEGGGEGGPTPAIAAAMARFSRQACDRLVAEQLLPALLPPD